MRPDARFLASSCARPAAALRDERRQVRRVPESGRGAEARAAARGGALLGMRRPGVPTADDSFAVLFGAVDQEERGGENVRCWRDLPRKSTFCYFQIPCFHFHITLEQILKPVHTY